MELQVSENEAFVVARVSGELTGTDAATLTESLHDHVSGAGSRLAIDLSTLQTVDSGGLSALVNLVTRARLSGGRVILVAPSPFVAGIFSVTNLDQWFDIAASMQDARF